MILELKFLGTGGAFDPGEGNSAATVDINGKRILIDCGASVFAKLHEKNLLESLDAVLLTHLHGDHSGSLFHLLGNARCNLNKSIPIIYPNDRMKRKIEALLKIQGSPGVWQEFVSIDAFSGVKAVDTYGKHLKGYQSFGYVFEDRDEFIYYSGDLGDVKVSEQVLTDLDTKNKSIRVFHEVSHLEGEFHVYYKDLEPLSEKYDMYVYHTNKRLLPSNTNLKLVEDQIHLLW